MKEGEGKVNCSTPVECADEADLVYLTDKVPGIKRKKQGRGYMYFDPSGRAIRNPRLLERINNLVLPPAWKEVWISPLKNGHLQATGVDAKGRKQYRYHAKWTEIRNRTKFNRMFHFGKSLPVIRSTIQEHTGLKSLSREKVLGTVISLLDQTLVRIGYDQYAKDNNTYGITTLRNKHIKNLGNKIRIEFSGKRNIDREVVIDDRRLAHIIRKCKELPGWELFKYYDEKGTKNRVTSGEVNEYIREITGENFTAKDFRTWGASCNMLKSLLNMEFSDKKSHLNKNIVEAVKEVSKCLGNTSAVCKKYYIHPDIIKSYPEGKITQLAEEKKHLLSSSTKYLNPEERFFLAFLQENKE